MDESIRDYLEAARVGRLATADNNGRPSVVPVCFAMRYDDIVTPLDEKPQSVAPEGLRRVRDIRENRRVALVVDHYTEEWTALGWVQVRGTAEIVEPGADGHDESVAVLRGKYDQYETHDLDARPVVRIEVGSTRSWGSLADQGHGSGSDTS